VADDPVIEDTAGEFFRIGTLCDGGQGKGAGDGIRIRIIVSDDPEGSLPPGQEGIESLGEPVCVEFVDLVDRGPGHDLLGVEDDVRPCGFQHPGPYGIQCPGYDMHLRILLLYCPDRCEVCLVIPGEHEGDLKEGQARKEAGVRDVPHKRIKVLVPEFLDPKFVPVQDKNPRILFSKFGRHMVPGAPAPNHRVLHPVRRPVLSRLLHEYTVTLTDN